jgi:hypothetical protein
MGAKYWSRENKDKLGEFSIVCLLFLRSLFNRNTINREKVLKLSKSRAVLGYHEKILVPF